MAGANKNSNAKKKMMDIFKLFLIYHKGRVWSSIVIVNEKSGFFFASLFRNISKTAETTYFNIKKKKNWAKPWRFGLPKSSTK